MPHEPTDLAELAAAVLAEECPAAIAAFGEDAAAVLRPVIEAVLTEAAAERFIADQLAKTGLKALDFRNGMSMEVEPARELVALWVGAARAMLGDAPNYSETRVEIPVEMVVGVAEDPQRYAFTLQRVGRLTPHEARLRAEKERDAAQAEAQQLRNHIAKLERAQGAAEGRPGGEGL
jgi:hypothetical protein